MLGDSKRIPSHIPVPNWHGVRATTKTTPLGRVRLDFFKYAAVIQATRSTPSGTQLTHSLLRVKRSGSEIPGRVYDYLTSQEGAVSGQELNHWREGTLDTLREVPPESSTIGEVRKPAYP